MLADVLRHLGRSVYRSLAWNLAVHLPWVERIVQPLPGKQDWVRISVRGRVFRMPAHPWWKTFAGDWEEDVFRAYRMLVRPGDTFVDVGAWIGPTVIFACACGAGRILAIEPNPKCRPYLDALIDSVATSATRLSICTVGVSASAGEAEFGNTDDHQVSTRSGASLFGRGARIQVARLQDLLAQHGIASPDFVKIDIEGGEFLIADQISALAAQPGIRLCLSLHPPLLPPGFDKRPLLDALQAFNLYDSRLKPITHAAVAARLESAERRPSWGTVFGNYFELMLAPAGESLIRDS